MKAQEIMIDAIDRFGFDNQIIVAIEELSELQKELCKELRGQGKRRYIIEEMADVGIMLKQLQIIFAITPQELMRMERDKLLRLEKRVEGATISGQA